MGAERPGSVDRRTLATGVAWSVPVVVAAGATPAFASSVPCEVTTNYDTLAVGTKPTTISFPPSTVTATLSYSHSGGADLSSNNGKVAQTSTTPSWKYIELELNNPNWRGANGGTNGSPNNRDWLELTVTLSQPMENLSILLHDIDSVQNGFWEGFQDQVIVSPLPTSRSLGSKLTGTGTSADPIRPSSWGDTPINDGAGAARLTWAGPLTTVTIHYQAGVDGNSANQHIGLGNISFSDCTLPGNPAARSAASTGRQQAPFDLDADAVTGDATVDH